MKANAAFAIRMINVVSRPDDVALLSKPPDHCGPAANWNPIPIIPTTPSGVSRPSSTSAPLAVSVSVTSQAMRWAWE
jgi:hypothetical protein